MLRITRLTDYATLMLVHMAADTTQVFSAKLLSDKTKVASPTVSKILKILSAHGLLLATRGSEGGYRLLKAPEAISLVDILSAMEGPIALTECAMTGHACLQAHDCGVQGHWQRINGVVMEALGRVTLADLVKSTETNPFVLRPSDLINSLQQGAVS